MATSLDAVLADLQKAQSQSQQANTKRYEQMMAIYDEVINRYQPGGSFGQSYLQQLGERKEQYIGQGQQDLISSGLFGTTTKAGLGSRFEKEIGGPERLKLEDIQMQRLSQAQLGQAGAIERVEDVGPDYGLIASLAGQASQQPTSSRSINWPSSTLPSGGGGGMVSSQPYGGIQPSTTDYSAYHQKLASASQAAMQAAQGTVYNAGNQPASTGGGTNLLSDADMAQINKAASANMGGAGTTSTANIYDQIRKAKTWEEYQGLAKGAGLVVGSKEEWQAASKRY